LKWLVIVSAVLLALVGLLPSASASDRLAGKIMIAIAVGFVLLALFAPRKVTAWIYFGSIAFVIAAYSLPMSFWRAVGLAKEQPSSHQPSRPPTNDR
jgi:hypothetical protein